MHLSSRKEKYALMAVGSEEMGDDAVALKTAKILKEKDLKGEWLVIRCGLYPENFVGVVTRSGVKVAVIVDAVEMGMKPGEIRIVEKRNLDTVLLTTHRIPLSFLLSYLEKEIEKVLFIGVQPKKLERGRGMSPELEKAANSLAESLLNGNFKWFERI